MSKIKPKVTVKGAVFDGKRGTKQLKELLRVVDNIYVDYKRSVTFEWRDCIFKNLKLSHNNMKTKSERSLLHFLASQEYDLLTRLLKEEKDSRIFYQPID